MTLAFVGVAGKGTEGGRPPGEAELAEALSGSERFNVLAPGAGLPEGLPRPEKDTNGSSELSSTALAEVVARTGADLVVSAELAEGGFERRLEITFQSGRYPGVVDHLTISLDDSEDMAALVKRLERRTPLARTWLGLSLIETRRSVNPIAITVEPSGPAASAGVVPGDRVVSLGGRSIENPRDLDDILSGLRVGTQASLTLQSPGASPRQANVVIGSTPVIRPFGAPRQLETLFLEEMSFIARWEADLGNGEGVERNTALLNLAVGLMRQRMWQAAIRDGFQRASLPEGPGISSGTISYLHGLCMRELELKTEARRLFEVAAGQEEATLWTNDGPPVSERARQQLTSL